MEQTAVTEGQGSPKGNGSEQPRHGAREAMGEIVHEGYAALERFGEALKQPTSGAAIAGAAVVGAGVLFGLAPAAVGAAAGYVVYRILKKQQQERQAA